MSANLLVVGSLNMDLVVNSPRLPQLGETILGGKFATFPGGKGANQAVAAARMGARVSMVGCVGRDGFGQELIDGLKKDQIEVSHISQIDAEASGIALITVDKNGSNTIVVASGANFLLTKQRLLLAETAFSEAEVLIVQLEVPLDTVREAIDLAVKHGIKVVLNPAPALVLDDELLSKVDYFIPNEREAIQVSETENLDDAISKLTGMGVKNLIITLGERGVLLVSAGEHKLLPAYKVEAVDTVAAGDAFVGAFSTGIGEGKSLEDAVRLGNAAAALSVTRHGAQPSLPFRSEVEKFIGEKK